MNRTAYVELISVHYLDAFKWLRKNMNMSIKEAAEAAKNGNKVKFEDFRKAVRFYLYLSGHLTTSARLFIDDSYDSRGCVASVGYSQETIDEDNKFAKELEDNGYANWYF